MLLSSKVMRADIPRLCLLIASLALGPAPAAGGGGGGGCERGRTWWHRQRGACVPCTRCDPRRLAVRYPCELHRDTVCQDLYEVRIWPFNTRRNGTNPSEVSSDYEYEYSDYNGATETSDELEWDVQTSTLTVAACGCVVFFVVVLTLSLYHAKQWRLLKRALRTDVQDLSAKLKLMEAGGETPAEPGMPADHHIYCNIHVGKEILLGPASIIKGLGNVYTQEKHAS